MYASLRPLVVISSRPLKKKLFRQFLITPRNHESWMLLNQNLLSHKNQYKALANTTTTTTQRRDSCMIISKTAVFFLFIICFCVHFEVVLVLPTTPAEIIWFAVVCASQTTKNQRRMIGEMLLLLPFQMSTFVNVSWALFQQHAHWKSASSFGEKILFACQRTNRGLSHLQTLQWARFQTGTEIRHSRTIDPKLTAVYPRLSKVYRRAGDNLQGAR